MLKKLTMSLAVAILLLTSCAPSINNEDEVVKDEDKSEQETSIVSNKLSDEDYRTLLPYRPSASRGVITGQMGNRLDIDEAETGLRRLSKDYFDPDEYLFEEGQYLDSDMLYRWLESYPTDDELSELKNQLEKQVKDNKIKKKEMEKRLAKRKQALNPPLDEENATIDDHEQNPKYVSHILEQDFLKRHDDDKVELSGVSIGIALKSVYRFEVEGNPGKVEISKSKMLDKGKEIAKTVLKRVRNIDALSDIPIMIALYREEDENAPVPGNFVAKTSVKSGEASISDWENLNEENVLFPSDRGEEKNYDTQQLVKNFGSRIEEYFPNYVGVIGDGFYIGDDLQELTLEIPIEFHGKEEVVGFTQYVSKLADEMFEDYYDLNINIKSDEKMESVISRDAGDSEKQVHVFDT
ncbi:CamS family sex pheromone protein [Barrientosiimonas marina]|uniref:CamS family sex pheromone protein n=1 Tax=Lentibacillus kimchii TaxID=1542911 RepID=A0ABW2US61_9BACI